jgi:hypothetical protein
MSATSLAAVRRTLRAARAAELATLAAAALDLPSARAVRERFAPLVPG